jgi:hypothetical protein
MKQVKNLTAKKEIYFEFFSLAGGEKMQGLFQSARS